MLVERHLKDRAKLSLGRLLGPRNDLRKLRFADIHPSQFGALASQGLFKQMVLAPCRILTSSGDRPGAESVILTPGCLPQHDIASAEPA